MTKIAHYRTRCVEDFKNAKKGSINLEEYANGFANITKINELKNQLASLLKHSHDPKILEALSGVTRKIHHEIERANFPYRYLDYETAVFGSARLDPESDEFKEVIEITKGIVSESRVGIITGAGPGVMEAANLGLLEAEEIRKKLGKKHNTFNRGLGIALPREYGEKMNPYIQKTSDHDNFGTRLNEFYDRSNSVISWNGGGGTDLENAQGYQLKQVSHIEKDFPLILKRSAWEEIQNKKMEIMYHQRKAEGKTELISLEDLKVFTLVDNPDEAIEVVLNHYNKWINQVFNKLDEESQRKVLSRDLSPVLTN